MHIPQGPNKGDGVTIRQYGTRRPNWSTSGRMPIEEDIHRRHDPEDYWQERQTLALERIADLLAKMLERQG